MQTAELLVYSFYHQNDTLSRSWYNWTFHTSFKCKKDTLTKVCNKVSARAWGRARGRVKLFFLLFIRFKIYQQFCGGNATNNNLHINSCCIWRVRIIYQNKSYQDKVKHAAFILLIILIYLFYPSISVCFVDGADTSGAIHWTSIQLLTLLFTQRLIWFSHPIVHHQWSTARRWLSITVTRC